MNNEPVAWMGHDYDGMKRELYFEEERNKLPYRLYETAIPLYTHPAKTQSNLINVVKNHIKDLQNCVKLFRSAEMDNTANEMEVAIKELEDALYTHPAKTLRHENHEWDIGVWTVGIDGMTKEFIESSDFHHDVRLYLNGDFETDIQRLNYLQHIADRLNTHPAKTLTDEEILSCWFETGQMLTIQQARIQFAKAILKKASEK